MLNFKQMKALEGIHTSSECNTWILDDKVNMLMNSSYEIELKSPSKNPEANNGIIVAQFKCGF